MNYDVGSDSYLSGDLTILSDHLIQTGIIEMAYQREQYDRVFIANGEGHLVSYSYIKSQDINGASYFELGGPSDSDGNHAIVESVEIIPSYDNSGSDEIWIIVQRYINGLIKRYIEVILDGIPSTDVADARYLDSFYTYDGVSTTTVSGLDHLEGEEVSVLVDGTTHPDVTVSSGSITLSRAAEKVQVGYSYQAKFESMNIEAGVESGNVSQGQKKRIPKISVRLLNTNNLKAGGSDDLIDEIPFRDSTVPMGSPIPLYNGDKTFSLNSRHGEDGRVILISDLPLPCTILALMQKVSTEVS